MRDVAEHVGVSRQLVSLVMRDVPGPSAETRERILAAAAELGYRANASARLLRQKRTRLIGALYSMRNPFESQVVEQLFARAAGREFGVVLGPMTSERTPGKVLDELVEQRVEALVGFVPDDWTASFESIGKIIPTVWLGGPVPAPHDNVHIDNVTGMRLAIEHLVGFGHRRIAHVRGTEEPAGQERARGYRLGMDLVGLHDEIDVLGAGWGEEDGANAARELLDRSVLPTAVICCSDQAAAGLLAVFTRAGVRVPEDVSIVGWDDSYVAALSYHRFTSVRQDVDATAEASLDAVLQRLADRDRPRALILTPATLVVRDSTGPARVD
ncbi:LacI family DNA-binding transcriptional regulator [Agromyces albus]|uniref:LacI family transcriptional regulator n=1 Tax=Agromyces albus TaxID=205332 RepID=A0A4Q2L5T6_9MICO|nr:LacI family DNA-binding transcriptional regulator [Agromyces albus]RXZ71823.1 LacI family transcriptional regulator [Agromyces albus]